MAKIDPEQERQRLIAFYSGQMDGELEKVATEAYELTDLAREALKAELARRGLGVELIENASVIPRQAQPGRSASARAANRVPSVRWRIRTAESRDDSQIQGSSRSIAGQGKP